MNASHTSSVRAFTYAWTVSYAIMRSDIDDTGRVSHGEVMVPHCIGVQLWGVGSDGRDSALPPRQRKEIFH